MSLLARTKLEFYADYIRHARSGGAAEAEIDREIAENTRLATCLLAGKCPTCGAPSTRYVNYQQQQGASAMPGTWVMYRCSTQAPPGQPNRPGACDFMADLIEGEASN